MRGSLYAAIVRRLNMDGIPNWCLGAHFERLGWGIGDLLAASDDELLQAKGFGPKALERWRSKVPRRVIPIPWTDPWKAHAEMVAGG